MKALVLAFTALVILAACSSGGSATAGPAAPGGGLGVVSGPVSDAGNTPGDQNSGADNGNGSGNGSSNKADASPGIAPYIVYTGTMDLQLKDVRSAVDQGDQLVAAMGGHVGSSETTTKDNQDY